MNKSILDILYFDEVRAKSLLSQFDEGIVSSSDHTSGTDTTGEGSVKGGVPLVGSGEVTTGISKSKQVLLRKTVYHEVVARLVDLLRDSKLLHNPADGMSNWRKDPDSSPYLYSSGYAAFDDFAHLSEFTMKFPWLADYLATLDGNSGNLSEHQMQAIDRLKKSYQALDDNTMPDKAPRLRKDVRDARKHMHESIGNSGLDLPDWTIESIVKWISIFSSDRLRLRMSMDGDDPFLLFADLDRRYFINDSSSLLLASYGARPNVKLSMLGLASSVPSENFTHPITQSVSEMEDDPEPSDPMVAIQSAFDLVFEHQIDLFKNMNGSTYPNIVVCPIAIFREFAVK